MRVYRIISKYTQTRASTTPGWTKTCLLIPISPVFVNVHHLSCSLHHRLLSELYFSPNACPLQLTSVVQISSSRSFTTSNNKSSSFRKLKSLQPRHLYPQMAQRFVVHQLCSKLLIFRVPKPPSFCKSPVRFLLRLLCNPHMLVNYRIQGRCHLLRPMAIIHHRRRSHPMNAVRH